MPNFASALKAEISRLARKESRSAVEGLRKALASQRTEIALLKRKVIELEKQVKTASRAATISPRRVPASPPAGATPGDESTLRFRASGMAANRKRLGLSAADFGLLVGTSSQSVYLWEQGKTKPARRSLAAIAALRGIGKREAAQRLAAAKAKA